MASATDEPQEEMRHREEANDLEVWRLLPWLANDSLEGEELSRVLRHLEHSAACRRELLFLSELRGAVETTSRDALEVSERRLGRLMGRIDRWEAARGDGRGGPSPPAARSPWRWVAAAVVLLGSFTSALWWAGRTDTAIPPQTPFRTLSRDDGAVVESVAGPRLRVIFEEGVSEVDLRALLLEVDAEIVAGPSAMGAYTIAWPSPASAGEGSRNALAEFLRADHRIAFAEPVGNDDG